LRKQAFILPAVLAGMALAASPAIASAAPSSPVMYDSTPVAGTVSVPSYGAEAYAFNQIGNEVILRAHTKVIKHVTVTMESWACQKGGWDTGSCTTTPGAKFIAPITLNLYRYSHRNPVTGEITPGKLITSITKKFAIPFRPSNDPTCPQVDTDANGNSIDSTYRGADGVCHHGIAQNVSFTVNRQLGNDVVWTVGYNTTDSGATPLNKPSNTMDNLNVGVTPVTRVGHVRYPDSIMWDTRSAEKGGAPFVTGELNLDSGWHGEVPAARFSTR
jgi:hypothetical protein